MARPPKNYCDYFTHDAGMRDHRKIKAIRTKFGITGYAIWCMILEYLTGIDGNEFEFSEVEIELMAGDFGVSVTEIRDVVDYCIRLELLFVDNGFIMSKSLDKRLKPVYDKRGVAKERSEKQSRTNGKFAINNTESIGISVTETPQSKLEYIKSEEINNIHPTDESYNIPEKLANKQGKAKNNKLEIKFEPTDETITASWYQSQIVSTLDQGSELDAQRKIAEYIRDKKPAFIEPYMHLWNIFAEKYSLRIIRGLPKERVSKFKTRIKEPAFDFLEILKAIRNSNNLRGENKNNWRVTWDYIMRSETTYLQILEDSQMAQK